MQPISLIAEANHSVHYLLKTYAQMCGFLTVQATVGERVLEMVRLAQPVLILLDINLPGKVRGWEALEYLKKDETIQSIPVIVYHLENQCPEEKWKGMANAWLQIPVLYDSFKETLTHAGVCFQEVDPNPGRHAERRSEKGR